jgi:hypothetical protein
MALRRRSGEDEPLGRVRLTPTRRPLATRTQLEAYITELEALAVELRAVVAPLREPDAVLDRAARSALAEVVHSIDLVMGRKP